MQPMGPMTCQSCGANAQIPPGQTIFTCSYCKVSYQIAAAFGERQQLSGLASPAPIRAPLPPPPAPLPFQQLGYGHAPRMVVVAPRSSSVFGIVLAVLLLPLIVAGFVASIIFLKGRSEWDGTETLSCDGNDDMTVSDVTSKLQSTVINAAGNCELHVKHCNLKGTVGILAKDNAHVIVEQGSVEGTETAIDVDANARVELHGTKLTGTNRKHSGNAKIEGP